MPNRLAALPAVHRLLEHPGLAAGIARHGRAAVRDALREVLAELRRRPPGGPLPAAEELIELALARIAVDLPAAYPAVINATGVLVHTNLGRAPRMTVPLPAYLALELDLDDGGRGERLAPVTARLTRYFGAEAATVVGNNAAALLLLLGAHAAGREVIVSRGELIEIGGSFRLPEIMAAAGVRLVEVGCTNRTRLSDYEAAIGEASAALLVVHRSNFFMEGFVASPAPAELAELAHRHALALWVDEGSGCHLGLERYGLRHEPTVQEILAAGADAVLCSGDKLLGGPQAGIVVGTEAAVTALRRHPLRRALRPDKAALVNLAATLDAHLAGRHEDVPLYRLLGAPEEALRRRARALARALGSRGIAARAVPSRAVIGGGTTPAQTLASWALELAGAQDALSRLRGGEPAVIGRAEEGRVLLDLRAVFPEQDRMLLAAAATALGPEPSARRDPPSPQKPTGVSGLS